MVKSNSKTAVVLFNLGGPDRPESIRPFLFNLFNDKAIIGLPQPFRFFLAKLISARRAPVAAEIYEYLGGKSPLLENTKAQARALESLLGKNFKCFNAMRYWRPFAGEVAEEVKTYNPDKIILLPLYPQFSTTTTGSSLLDWDHAARKTGLEKPTAAICCFPTDDHFITAHAKAIEPYLDKIKNTDSARILFTAHGLPEKIVKGGDPYAWQVEKTVAAIVASLKKNRKRKLPEHVVCYQSRVGPLKWIGPSTEEEIVRAGNEGKGLVVVPIAFVSEHSETLVELDIEYKELARAHNIKHYLRVPALGPSKDFIRVLAGLVKDVMKGEGICPPGNKRLCPGDFSKCPCGGNK